MTDFKPNLEETKQFLEMLGGEDIPQWWRVIPKQGGVYNLNGTLEELAGQLEQANRSGAGIFLTINETDGKGARGENVQVIRTMVADFDDPNMSLTPIRDCGLNPQMIVESSKGKHHVYWRVADCDVRQYKQLQQALIRRFNSDPAVCNPAQVMRVPGFYHQKSEPVLTRIVECSYAPPYLVDQIVAELGLDLSTEPEVRFLGLDAKAKTLEGDIFRPASEGNRNSRATEVAGHLLGSGKALDVCRKKLHEWNSKNEPPLGREELDSVLNSIAGREINKRISFIDRYNEQFAVVRIGGKTLVMNDTGDTPVYQSKRDFCDYFAYEQKIAGKPAAQYWFEHEKRRHHPAVIFNPRKITTPISGEPYNLWSGFALDPSSEGSCDRYLDHLEKNICGGNPEIFNYVLDWMADAVQNPAVRPGVALVLRGGEGTGKNTFVDGFSPIFGRHFRAMHDAEHFLGKNTMQIAHTLLLLANEAVWGGKKAHDAALKTLITDDTRTVEDKFIPQAQMDNYVRLILASNEDWVVPAGKGSRRFLLLDVGDEHKDDHKYFSAIQHEMKNGGTQALMHLLLQRDLSGRNLRIVPKTDALLDQKLYGLPAVASWVFEFLQSGTAPGVMGSFNPGRSEWHDFMNTEAAYSEFLEFSERMPRWTKGRGLSKSIFVKEFRRILPLTSSKPTINGGRIPGYLLPELATCREMFEHYIGQPVSWETPSLSGVSGDGAGGPSDEKGSEAA